ncbi:hypothetical protein B0H13DRAFT_1902973 [Mycena leptocephala]|nr:hypothetical protein B0H13DRAFT_1902973 [Mycena leptocephala]
MTLNGSSYYSSKSQHSVLLLEIPGKRYSPQFRGVAIGTVVGQELTAGGRGVNMCSSLPMGYTEEVKDLFKKQTMLFRAVETLDSGERPCVKTEGVVITGSAMIEDLIISAKAKILRWTKTGFFPHGPNLAMRVSLTRLDTVKGGLSNSTKKTCGSPKSNRIFEGNAFGTQEVETDCLNIQPPIVKPGKRIDRRISGDVLLRHLHAKSWARLQQGSLVTFGPLKVGNVIRIIQCINRAESSQLDWGERGTNADTHLNSKFRYELSLFELNSQHCRVLAFATLESFSRDRG